MFSRIWTRTSTAGCWAQIERLRRALADADAVVIGAGAGLSASAGLTYSGARFEAHFRDFMDKYGIEDMYTGGFYPFPSPEEHWAWWSRHIAVNCHAPAPQPVYDDLLRLAAGRDYFVLTTNVDHQFQLAGFDRERLFCTQGDYGLWQCSRPCCQRTYSNREAVERMLAEQRDMRIPTELIPYCPVCGAPMAMHLRADSTFVQDSGWYAARNRYQDFLRRYRGLRVVYLELGVGRNTPAIIKYPFWRYTAENSRALYVCINEGEAFAPERIADRALCIDRDIGQVLRDLTGQADSPAEAGPWD